MEGSLGRWEGLKCKGGVTPPQAIDMDRPPAAGVRAADQDFINLSDLTQLHGKQMHRYFIMYLKPVLREVCRSLNNTSRCQIFRCQKITGVEG